MSHAGKACLILLFDGIAYEDFAAICIYIAVASYVVVLKATCNSFTCVPSIYPFHTTVKPVLNGHPWGMVN